MNTGTTTKRAAGFTLIELVVVIAIIAVFAGMVDCGSIFKAKARAQRINCVSNLKQVGTACLVFANDHNGLFSGELSVNEDGSKKIAPSRRAFEYFQVLSNELSSPKVLVCPADVQRPPTSNFLTLNNSTLSYFAGLDAVSNNAAMFLAGDRNLTRRENPLSNGVFTISTNESLGWTDEIHKGQGNVGLADGSVMQVSVNKLRELAKESRNTQRLSVP